MRKLFVAIAAAALAASALAAKTPAEIAYETRAGTVTFPHRLHAARGCKGCHKGQPAKLAGFDKDMAHQLCKGCHENVAKGPIRCDGCHKR